MSKPTSSVPETELPLSAEAGNHLRPSRYFRNTLLGRLGSLKGGVITVFDSAAPVRLGGEIAENAPDTNFADVLTSSVVVKDQAIYKKILFGGTIGSAESYMAGDWGTDNLTDLIRIMIRNMNQVTSMERTWSRLKNSWYWFQHLFRRNSVSGSRKNIHEHYDLGNDFYKLFLDPTMSYSAGLFSNDSDRSRSAMEQASLDKMECVCRKLQIDSSDHVLEIGTGWGGLAIYMAKNFGCRVTTATISQEQYRYAVEQVNAAGLEDLIEVRLEDYRLLEGKFDKIVSIEMIEAVGHQYYDCFFEKASSLLNDDGAMLLQAITMSEQNYAYHISHVDFIRRYVFPGGCLPSISALSASMAKKTDMRMLHVEDITKHYVSTLQCWRLAFFQHLDEIRGMGFEESFIRLWNFYLCYCEAAFAEKRVHLDHLVYAKPGCQIDPAIDYPQELVSEKSDPPRMKTRQPSCFELNKTTECLLAQKNSC